jgi:hypothetical protein
VANPLPVEKVAVALRLVTAWRLDPNAPLNCPVCTTPGLNIIDQSARPYAEWYALSCPSCGLEHTLHIPLGPPVLGGME